jgi:hypothetical protein
VEDWNALDWFLRHNIYIDCYIGAGNWFGEGGFHVYESQFFNSTFADVAYGISSLPVPLFLS